MNTPIIGRIYHVVDKRTGEVVKVGSTIQTLQKRFSDSFYKKKYINHILMPFKEIVSSELDWYQPKNPYCPFLWHLIASEHMEILRANTFRRGPYSNKRSPLDEKYFGFDSAVANQYVTLKQMQLNGKKQGRKNASIPGFLSRVASLKTKEARIASGYKVKEAKKGIFGISKEARLLNARKGGLAAGKIAKESGQIQRLVRQNIENKTSIFAPGMRSRGGKISGRMNVQNGTLERARHTHWHTNRNLVNPLCRFCKGG